MSAELARLGIIIESGSIKPAREGLDTLTESSKRTEKAVRQLSKAEEEYNARQVLAARATIQHIEQQRQLERAVGTTTRSFHGMGIAQQRQLTGWESAGRSLAGYSAHLRQANTQSASAAINFGRLRGSVTSLAASFLHLAPGVGTASSILGSMMIGSGLMVAVLAGLAAVAFAWERITRTSREAKREQEKALERAQEIGKRRRQGFLGDLPDTEKGLTALRDSLLREIQEARVTRVVGNAAGTVTTIAPNQQRIQELIEKLTEVSEAIRDIRTETTVLSNEDTLRKTAEADAAAAKALAAELSRLAASYASVRLEMILAMQAGGPFRFAFPGRVGGPVSISGDGLHRRGMPPLNVVGRGARPIQRTTPNLPEFGIIRNVEPLSEGARERWNSRHATVQMIEDAQRLQQSAQGLANTMAGSFARIVTGTESVSDAWRRMVTGVIEEMTRLATQRALTDLFSKILGIALPGAAGLAGAGGSAGVAVPDPVILPPGVASVRQGGRSLIVNQTNTINLSSLDPRTHATLLEEQAPTIFGIVGRGMQHNSGLRSLLND